MTSQQQQQQQTTIEHLRSSAVSRKHHLISKAMLLRERDRRELDFLSSPPNHNNNNNNNNNIPPQPPHVSNVMKFVVLSCNNLLDYEDKSFSIPSRPSSSSSSSFSLKGSSSSNRSPPSLLPPPSSGSILSHSNIGSLHGDVDRDTQILYKIVNLQKAGLWGANRYPKWPEPGREKVHWDYLLAEMVWLANDFKAERKWKIALARKTANAVIKEAANLAIRRNQVVEEIRAQKEIAKSISDEVEKFWDRVNQMVSYKKRVIDQQCQQKGQLNSLLDHSPSQHSSGQVEETAFSLDNNEPNESDMLFDAAYSFAQGVQPTGFTLSTTAVKIPIPFLLRGTLKEYQHIGLNWLVSMWEKKLNGILADDSGLGKTIETIALLAHLACAKGVWGPHLLIVPSSLMQKWELELKRWCPSFKLLTYCGSQTDKRLTQGRWIDPNSFHICITSYTIALQDQRVLQRKKWRMLILDEAQHIKDFKSQRWQALLSFQSDRRLLITGTPLPNSLVELLSLTHFLIPEVFRSHPEFLKCFPNQQVPEISEESGKNSTDISRLHELLQPFLLRRRIEDVVQQLPKIFDHMIKCPMSGQQEGCYEEILSHHDSKEALNSGSLFKVMPLLLQLQKVCNHPDLLESPIVFPFRFPSINLRLPSLLSPRRSILSSSQSDPVPTHQVEAQPRQFFRDASFGFNGARSFEGPYPSILYLNATNFLARESEYRVLALQVKALSTNDSAPKQPTPPTTVPGVKVHHIPANSAFYHYSNSRREKQSKIVTEEHSVMLQINQRRADSVPLYGSDLRKMLTIGVNHRDPTLSSIWQDLNSELSQITSSYVKDLPMTIPAAKASPPSLICGFPDPFFDDVRSLLLQESTQLIEYFQHSFVQTRLHFPDRKLVQTKCGKFWVLDSLLRKLKKKGQRILIFSQMNRMLDILEIFMSIHGHSYFRLENSSNTETRQKLAERFNIDSKIFAFLLSTRSGDLGTNLTGADAVIFYDNDWNSEVYAQALNSCFKMAQLHDVHIYRFVTEHTVEENLLKSVNQKTFHDGVVISDREFPTGMFSRFSIKDLFEDKEKEKRKGEEELLQQLVIEERSKQEQIEQGKQKAKEQPEHSRRSGRLRSRRQKQKVQPESDPPAKRKGKKRKQREPESQSVPQGPPSLEISQTEWKKAIASVEEREDVIPLQSDGLSDFGFTDPLSRPQLPIISDSPPQLSSVMRYMFSFSETPFGWEGNVKESGKDEEHLGITHKAPKKRTLRDSFQGHPDPPTKRRKLEALQNKESRLSDFPIGETRKRMDDSEKVLTGINPFPHFEETEPDSLFYELDGSFFDVFRLNIHSPLLPYKIPDNGAWIYSYPDPDLEVLYIPPLDVSEDIREYEASLFPWIETKQQHRKTAASHRKQNIAAAENKEKVHQHTHTPHHKKKKSVKSHDTSSSRKKKTKEESKKKTKKSTKKKASSKRHQDSHPHHSSSPKQTSKDVTEVKWPAWSIDEENALFELTKHYGSNWELICDILSSMEVGVLITQPSGGNNVTHVKRLKHHRDGQQCRDHYRAHCRERSSNSHNQKQHTSLSQSPGFSNSPLPLPNRIHFPILSLISRRPGESLPGRAPFFPSLNNASHSQANVTSKLNYGKMSPFDVTLSHETHN